MWSCPDPNQVVGGGEEGTREGENGHVNKARTYVLNSKRHQKSTNLSLKSWQSD